MSNATVDLAVSRLPTTWVTYEAWESSFRAWQRLNRLAQESNPDSLMNAKWRDFKVYMDNNHRKSDTLSAFDRAIPVGVAAGIGNASCAYEWVYSTIDFPEDTDITGSYPLHMIGGNDLTGSQSLGIIHNYALARERPMSSEPNVPVSATGGFGDSYLNTLFDFGDSFEQVTDAAITENDEPPYPVGLWPEDPAGNQTGEYYPGGANYLGAIAQHVVSDISIYNNRAADIRANAFVPGFSAPLGLVAMVFTAPDATEPVTTSYNLDVFVDLVPGPSNGVMARSMLEAN